MLRLTCKPGLDGIAALPSYFILACFLIKVVCLFVFLGLFEDIFGHGSTDPCANLFIGC